MIKNISLFGFSFFLFLSACSDPFETNLKKESKLKAEEKIDLKNLPSLLGPIYNLVWHTIEPFTSFNRGEPSKKKDLSQEILEQNKIQSLELELKSFLNLNPQFPKNLDSASTLSKDELQLQKEELEYQEVETQLDKIFLEIQSLDVGLKRKFLVRQVEKDQIGKMFDDFSNLKTLFDQKTPIDKIKKVIDELQVKINIWKHKLANWYRRVINIENNEKP